MNIKETVASVIQYGFAPIPRFKDKESGQWKLRKFINKDTGEYGYPLNHKAWVNDMPSLSLVLLNCVLIDLDANKENCTDTIDDLKEKVCELLNIDDFDLDMALFQENDQGDSLHYMFKLPGDINFADIAQSNDGKIIKNVDFKTGRQLVHLKEGKKVHFVHVDDFTELSAENVYKIFKESKTYDTTSDFNIVSETTKYGKGALRGINNDATLFTEEGGRNFALSKAVVSIYELVAGGEISEEDATKEIDNIVCELGIENEADTVTTIEYNKIKGLKQPKAAPNNQKELITHVELEEKKLTVDDANNVDDLKEVMNNIANSKIDSLSLELLLKKIQKKYKLLVGESPSLPALKKIIKANKVQRKKSNYVDDYVFMTSTGEYMQRDTKALMGPRAFDVKHTRDTETDEEGFPQSATTYSNNLIQCVENSMYVPKFADIFNHNGLEYINLYTPNNIKLVSVGTTNIIERIKGHIAHLLPRQDEQDLIINYLAHNVQFAGKKIQWSIVLQGVQGDGKSLLAEMMQHVMGFNNVRLMNVQTLESPFTGWSAGQCMTFIEELKLDNYKKYEILNNLKPYITNDVVECTKKGKDPQVVVNTTNYFALTNFKDALPIDSTDRRWAIFFSQWQSSQKLIDFISNNPDYYSDLYRDMRNNVGEIAQWLKDHVIPQSFKDMKRAPDTSAKDVMLELSKSDASLLIEDAINEFHCDDINFDVLNITKLSKLVNDDFSEGYEDWPKKGALKTALNMMGFHNIGRYQNEEKKNQTIYAKDDTKTAKELRIIEAPF